MRRPVRRVSFVHVGRGVSRRRAPRIVCVTRLNLDAVAEHDRTRVQLRNEVWNALRGTAMRSAVDLEDKEQIRGRHLLQRDAQRESMANVLRDHEDELLEEFANGCDVDPASIRPRIIPVKTDDDALLFRYAALFWSVPVTGGYGRRTRFLVRDRQNDKLIGIFALSDPVYNLRVRDQAIGWRDQAKRSGLYRVLDASVVGAVQPYSQLLGGKLVALAAISKQTLGVVERKYRGTVTEIKQRSLTGTRPVLITTTSALGRSSLYNRLRRDERWFYRSIGWTEGYGHFELPKELFDRLVDLLDEAGHSEAKANQFGDGPSWKMRVIRLGLEYLGLPANMALFHGIPREVFVAPTAKNWREVLGGRTTRASWYADDLEELSSFYRERWAVPRAERMPAFRQFNRESLRLGHGSGVIDALTPLVLA